MVTRLAGVGLSNPLSSYMDNRAENLVSIGAYGLAAGLLPEVSRGAIFTNPDRLFSNGITSHSTIITIGRIITVGCTDLTNTENPKGISDWVAVIR